MAETPLDGMPLLRSDTAATEPYDIDEALRRAVEEVADREHALTRGARRSFEAMISSVDQGYVSATSGGDETPSERVVRPAFLGGEPRRPEADDSLARSRKHGRSDRGKSTAASSTMSSQETGFLRSIGSAAAARLPASRWIPQWSKGASSGNAGAAQSLERNESRVPHGQ